MRFLPSISFCVRVQSEQEGAHILEGQTVVMETIANMICTSEEGVWTSSKFYTIYGINVNLCFSLLVCAVFVAVNFVL